MKKAIFFISFTLAFASVNAQSTGKTETIKPQAQTQINALTNPEPEFFMVKGQVMMEKAGALYQMESDYKFINGTYLMMDGSIIKPSGEKVMMEVGDHLDSDGNLTRNPHHTKEPQQDKLNPHQE